MIPQRNLSVIANRLLTEIRGEGHPNARRVPERTIELDYCLSWFLACFGEHPFGKDISRTRNHWQILWLGAHQNHMLAALAA
jgi:hypothetical protein